MNLSITTNSLSLPYPITSTISATTQTCVIPSPAMYGTRQEELAIDSYSIYFRNG